MGERGVATPAGGAGNARCGEGLQQILITGKRAEKQRASVVTAEQSAAAAR